MVVRFLRRLGGGDLPGAADHDHPAGLDDRSDTRRPANRSDTAYGMANPGNVSPRRRHVSGKHFELFSRRTQSCREPGRAQSFAPKVATEWCEALTPARFPKMYQCKT